MSMVPILIFCTGGDIMTRQDFIAFAIEKHPLNRNAKRVGFEPYSRNELETEIRREYSEKYDVKHILDFFESVGTLYFNRIEQKSGDRLTIDIRWLAYIYYWEDINAVANRIGYIENCSGIVKTLYLSENGNFYDQDHILLAENEEKFFDYLATAEFDHHPEITERTYEMLRFFGWYEGRHIDTADLNKEMLKRGIELTQKQLDFLSEFSGLHFRFKDYYSSWRFYSLDEILRDNSTELRTGYKDTVLKRGEVVAENALVCGDAPDTPDPIYIDSEGRLLTSGLHLGRNSMESINHLANNVNETAEWV